MLKFVRGVLKTVYTPVCWTLITIGLLCLPGTSIPDLGEFSFEYLDKIVHILIFSVLVFLWSYYLLAHKPATQRGSGLTWIVLAAVVLGVVLETVQFYFIPFRDFDPADIVANSFGAILASSLFNKLVSSMEKEKPL